MNASKTIVDLATLEATVRQAVATVTISDIHTHLFPPNHGPMLLWGVDELLTYHYLVAELFDVAPRSLTPDAFWQMPKRRQANLVWQHVFLEHGGLSEAARGVLTTLQALGLDPAGRDLAGWRAWFERQEIAEHLPRVLKLAGLDWAVMTNDPFKPTETQYWDAGLDPIECLRTALRIDTLVLDWPAASAVMSAGGYDVYPRPDARAFSEALRFLMDWGRRIRPMYMAISLPDSFAYPAQNVSSAVLDNVILPAARELGIPLAMMVGVRRGVNPAIGDAGDGVGTADLAFVADLCRKYPQNKFLATVLSPVNQHELCVLARKFGNLHVFGCWWFCNVPSIIRQTTQMRLELLGTAFTAQHSDARVLEQLIYKWSHSRQVIADVLAGQYAAQFQTGWRPTSQEIARDVRALLGGSFEAFCRR